MKHTNKQRLTICLMSITLVVAACCIGCIDTSKSYGDSQDWYIPETNPNAMHIKRADTSGINTMDIKGVDSSGIFGGYTVESVTDSSNNAAESAESVVDSMQSQNEYSDKTSNPNYGEKHKAEIVLANEKLVYTCDTVIETTDYLDSMTKINALIKQYGGVIQYSKENNNDVYWYLKESKHQVDTHRCEMSIRIPSSNFEAVVSGLNDTGKVMSKEQVIDNISQEYYDTTTEIKSLELQEERVLKMMEQANTVDEMLSLDSRLTEINTKLMKLKTDIQYMDMDVAYSYLNLTVEEVYEYTPDEQPVKTQTFIDRLKNVLLDTWKGLIETLEGLLFFIISITPYIIILVILVLVYLKFIKSKVDKQLQKRRAKKLERKQMVDNLSEELDEENNEKSKAN